MDDIVRDLARIGCVRNFTAVDMLDRGSVGGEFERRRIAFDIACRSLVLATVGILERHSRCGLPRHCQRITRRRMTIAGQSAIDLTAERRCCAVIGDIAALKAARLQQKGVRRTCAIIRDKSELMRLGRRRRLTCRIVRECQRIGIIAALQKGHALDAVLRREVVRRQPRAVDGDFIHVNARSVERTCIRDGQHRITECSLTVQFELVVLEVIDRLRRDILGIDVERIAHRRLVAAVDIALRERHTREIAVRIVAKVDDIARRRAIAMCIAAVNIARILETTAIDGNRVVCHSSCPSAEAAIDRTLGLAARDSHAVVCNHPCTRRHICAAICASTSDLTARDGDRIIRDLARSHRCSAIDAIRSSAALDDDVIAVIGTVTSDRTAAPLCQCTESHGDGTVTFESKGIVFQTARMRCLRKTSHCTLTNIAALDCHGISHNRTIRRRGSAADHHFADLLGTAIKTHGDMVVRRITCARRIAAVDGQIRVVRIRDLDLVVRRRIAETRIAAIDRCACDVVRRRIGVLEAVDIRLDERGSVFSKERMTIRLHMVLIVACRTLFAAGRIVADLHI